MKLITFISAGAFILLSAFIMKKNKSADQSLYNTKWSLKKIYTEAGVEEVHSKAFIKFDSAKKSAGGNGSCNSFGSSITVNDDKVSLKNIFSTKMYCEGVQKTEDAFLNQLSKANKFEIKNKILTLYEDDSPLLEFIAE